MNTNAMFKNISNNSNDTTNDVVESVPNKIWQELDNLQEQIDHSLFTDIHAIWTFSLKDKSNWTIYTSSTAVSDYPIHVTNGATGINIALEIWKCRKTRIAPQNITSPVGLHMGILTMKEMVASVIDRESQQRCHGCSISRIKPTLEPHTCVLDRRYWQEKLFIPALEYVKPVKFKKTLKRNCKNRGIIIERVYLLYHYIVTQCREQLRTLVIEASIFPNENK